MASGGQGLGRLCLREGVAWGPQGWPRGQPERRPPNTGLQPGLSPREPPRSREARGSRRGPGADGVHLAAEGTRGAGCGGPRREDPRAPVSPCLTPPCPQRLPRPSGRVWEEEQLGRPGSPHLCLRGCTGKVPTGQGTPRLSWATRLGVGQENGGVRGLSHTCTQASRSSWARLGTAKNGLFPTEAWRPASPHPAPGVRGSPSQGPHHLGTRPRGERAQALPSPQLRVSGGGRGKTGLTELPLRGWEDGTPAPRPGQAPTTGEGWVHGVRGPKGKAVRPKGGGVTARRAQGWRGALGQSRCCWSSHSGLRHPDRTPRGIQLRMLALKGLDPKSPRRGLCPQRALDRGLPTPQAPAVPTRPSSSPSLDTAAQGPTLLPPSPWACWGVTSGLERSAEPESA